MGQGGGVSGPPVGGDGGEGSPGVGRCRVKLLFFFEKVEENPKKSGKRIFSCKKERCPRTTSPRLIVSPPHRRCQGLIVRRVVYSKLAFGSAAFFHKSSA